jgi:outer membrane protein OmpA-like peptidoglycan-associated protein
MDVHEPPPKEPDMNRYLSTIALAIAAAWLTPEAHAEKVVIYREGQLVQPQDVAEVLGGTRSLKLLDDEPSPAAPKTFTAVASTSLTKTSAPSPTAARTPRHDAAPSALSLPVRFAFDSAEILPQAREQLDSLAQGIKMLAPERIVTVEGHTDATGTDAYNLALSQARARAVRDYLVQHGIDAARLKTVGYGEERPLEGTDPYAPLNRRVQFRGS